MSDRVARGAAAIVLGACAVMAPLPLWITLGGFGVTAIYLMFTALGGACLGYRFMGRSTCAIERR